MNFQLLLAFSFAFILFGCNLNGDENPLDESPEMGFIVDTLHSMPAPYCSPMLVMSMVSTDPTFDGQNFGNIEVVNNLTDLGVSFRPLSGLSVVSAALWWQNGGCDGGYVPCNYPTDGKGGLDPGNFPRNYVLNPIKNDFTFYQPINTLQQCNTYAACAMLGTIDANGNLLFTVECWASGKTAGTAGFVFDWCMQKCAEQSADPWLPSNQPQASSAPASTIESNTAGSCTGCQSENTVTVDCSNPTCVDVSSCKDLSNVVLGFADGTTHKFDNLSGTSGNFCSPNGQDIYTVWVKSGCYQSGDGPGFGRRFDLCGNSSPI